MFEFKFEAMGTELEIKVLNPVSKILEEKIKSEIFDFTIYYDNTFSRFKSNSLITKLSEQVGKFNVPKELVEMLEIYKKFNQITNGSMNPLIGYTLSDLGYDASYTLKKKEFIRPTPNFSTAFEIIDNQTIYLHEKVLIDIGAIGKGFWVDQVKKILDKNGVTDYIINGSGDIFYSSPGLSGGRLNVWLENSDGKVFAKTQILNESICGSGIHKRNWSIKEDENLHHIIDAKKSTPTENIESVWIKTCSNELSTTLADGLATAIFFVDPEVLKEKVKNVLGIDFEYFIIYTNKKTLFSKNFNVTPVLLRLPKQC